MATATATKMAMDRTEMIEKVRSVSQAGRTGFTLIELMVAVALFGLLAFYLFSFYGRQINLQQLAGSRDHTTQQAAVAMNRITAVMHEQTVSLAASNDQLTDAEGTPLVGSNAMILAYSKVDHTLIDAKSKQTLADHIQMLSISDDPNHPAGVHLFSIKIVVQKGSDHPYELDTKVFKTDPR